MKKLAIMICALCVVSTAANAAAENASKTAVKQAETPAVQQEQQVNEGIKNPPSKEEMIKKRKAREAAFEQKLGLTEAQKAQVKELRIQGHKKMKPVMEQIKLKKQEARVVKLSRISVEMQNEKLAVINKELAELEKQAKEIRKQNMKDFESILTRDQKKILKQMKKEGREKFKKGAQHPCPPPCPVETTEKPTEQK